MGKQMAPQPAFRRSSHWVAITRARGGGRRDRGGGGEGGDRVRWVREGWGRRETKGRRGERGGGERGEGERGEQGGVLMGCYGCFECIEGM